MEIFMAWFETCCNIFYPLIMKAYEFFDKIFLTTVGELLVLDSGDAVLAFVPDWIENISLLSVIFGVGLTTFVVYTVVKWIVDLVL